jgi:hypothetical protein
MLHDLLPSRIAHCISTLVEKSRADGQSHGLICIVDEKQYLLMSNALAKAESPYVVFFVKTPYTETVLNNVEEFIT